jgi:hypothetical protein
MISHRDPSSITQTTSCRVGPRHLTPGATEPDLREFLRRLSADARFATPHQDHRHALSAPAPASKILQ